MESSRITSDIERVETSVTVAGRRISVRAALILMLGVLLSIGLVGVLQPAFGTPLLFLPIGMAPLYIAALMAFVRPGDGRPMERQLLDRIRFARATRLAANLGRADLERPDNVLDLSKEVFTVADTRTGEEVRADLSELDLPLTVRGKWGLEITIDDLRIEVRRKEEGDEIAVTVRQA